SVGGNPASPASNTRSRRSAEQGLGIAASSLPRNANYSTHAQGTFHTQAKTALSRFLEQQRPGKFSLVRRNSTETAMSEPNLLSVPDPLAVSPAAAARLVGIGRTKLYEAI